MAPPRLRVDRIERLLDSIDPVFLRTPTLDCAPLAEALADEAGSGPARVDLKLELFNPVRSFKGRGAEALVAAGGRDAVVCASAGNFGQAMAYACRRRGVRVTVFAAHDANPLKVARMRALGAVVRLEGADFDDAKARARRHAADAGQRFVEDGREAEVSEGAGTIALELLAARDLPDVLLVPLGNGALLAGIATVVRQRGSGIRIVAVAAEGAPAMVRSLREGRPVATERVETIADGIAVRVPVPEALDDLVGLVDDTVLVGDAALRRGMRLLIEHAGVVAEPAAAAGVAALLGDPTRFAGRHVATIVTGGSVTMADLRGLITDGGDGATRPPVRPHDHGRPDQMG